MQELLMALGLVMVIEGLMPFAGPRKWRSVMILLAQQSDKALRSIGFFSMMIGLAIIVLVRHY